MKKNLILKQAFSRFEEDAEYKAFVKKNAGWLTDYALYMACKDANEGKEWNDWEAPYRRPDRKEKSELKKALAEEMKYYNFETMFISLATKVGDFLHENRIYFEISKNKKYYHFEILTDPAGAEMIDKYIKSITISEEVIA